jgi:hypothetical protein
MSVTIERAEYKGWFNCWRIANGEVELVVTADVGPRVISFGFADAQNLFKNFDEQMGTQGEAAWIGRGGSRIWIAPEDREASYAPDNLPVEIEIKDGALIATAPVEHPVRIQKQMVIRMSETGTGVEIRHRIRNAGLLPTEFAAWILTVMAPGGTAITGFPPRGTHPEDLPPTHPLVMWAFTDLSDPRWRFQKKYLMLRQCPGVNAPQKLGHFNRKTWGAYLLNGDLFIKRYNANEARQYPDFGCSFEIFTNGEVLELETLGPLCRVMPNEWIEHTECWSLDRNVVISEWTDDELDRIVAPLVEMERPSASY